MEQLVVSPILPAVRRWRSRRRGRRLRRANRPPVAFTTPIAVCSTCAMPMLRFHSGIDYRTPNELEERIKIDPLLLRLT